MSLSGEMGSVVASVVTVNNACIMAVIVQVLLLAYKKTRKKRERNSGFVLLF